MNTDGPHIFFDFDSTIITRESFDDVIERALENTSNKAVLVKKVEDITNRGMEGVLPFTQSLTERFAIAPLHRTDFINVGDNLLDNITDGMESLFKKLQEKNISTYIISGGFIDCISPVAKKLNVPMDRVFANKALFDDDGTVIGIDTHNICYTDDGKAPVIEYIKKINHLTGISCMVGDGGNDLKAFELGVVDYFCGFTANVERDIIRDNAPAISRSTEELGDFIFTR